MEVIAKLKNLRMSPNKVRLVADLVRGLSVADAIDQLTYSKRWAAKPMLKLINSAVANASHNFKLEGNRLFVKTLQVNMGPSLKRAMPRAHGRAYPIRKKFSHVLVILDEKVDKSKEIVAEVPETAKLKSENKGQKKI